jgi:photolyase PhrII
VPPARPPSQTRLAQGDGRAAIDQLQLPPPLQERLQALTPASPRQDGDFVLYWAHHALRAHENPALEAAATIARQRGLPLLVYQGLGGRHRYNSDRHHRFILEAARDFATELRERGQHLLFHLPEDPLAPGPLPDLLRRAALVVSELFPVPPFTRWYARHAAREPDLPFLLVDCSCNLPMTLSTGLETRAFRFRKAYMADLRRRIAQGWANATSWPRAFTGDPGFTPFDLDRSLDDAIAACRIDHSVPPLADTPGGSTAGYRRWRAFLEQGLDAYHRLRDDAALPAAVSRLSPYLHYGCVSPFRVAREAAARGGEGAEKFLDELLTWRELSHHFCHRSPDLESLDALPGWARSSLEDHTSDPREKLLDWEALARGRSGEPLWDLAQRSLLRRGELHNNVRMSWGKAFLSWAAHPARALKLMIDLNHRYALDGSDPNSYGGLLWCLGQFDRAFPPGPVFGKVRQRSLRRHAERLDLARYAQQVSRPANGRRLRVAVVGAGLAGLSAARALEDQGHEVVVVDKARGPGGRMSTRREGEWQFDHGAQYFTARDPRFRRHVLAWLERGMVEPWSARIARIDDVSVEPANADAERYVPTPSMNAIC